MTLRHILPGSIRPDGSIDPTPLIVELDDDGQVISHAPLGRIEPPATTPLRALLDLQTLTIRSLKTYS